MREDTVTTDLIGAARWQEHHAPVIDDHLTRADLATEDAALMQADERAAAEARRRGDEECQWVRDWRAYVARVFGEGAA